MEKLLVVRVGDKSLGWRTSHVGEIFAMPHLTPLLEPVPHLSGAVFHRGRLLTVADTASLAGLPASAHGKLLIRLAPPSDHLAFSLDSVEGVMPYNALDLREETSEGLWEGLYPWEERWVPILRASQAVAALSLSLLPSAGASEME